MPMYYWRGSTLGTHGAGISADGATGSATQIYGLAAQGGQLAASGITARQFWSQFGWNVPGNWLIKEAETGSSGDFEGWNYRRTTAIPGGGDHVRFARLTLPLGEPVADGSTASTGFESIPHTPLIWGGFWNKPGSGTTHEMGWLYAGNTSDKLKTIRIEPSFGTGVVYHNFSGNDVEHAATHRGEDSFHFDDHFGAKFGVAGLPIGSTHSTPGNKNNCPDGDFQNFGAWGHIGINNVGLARTLLEQSIGGTTHEFGGFSGGVTGWINVGVTAGNSENKYALPGGRCLGLVVKAEKFLGVPDKATTITFVDSQIDAVYASGSRFQLQGGTYGEVHALTPITEAPCAPGRITVGDFTPISAVDTARANIPVQISTLLDIHTGSFYDPEFPSYNVREAVTGGIDSFSFKSSTTIGNVVVAAPARPRQLRIDANVTTAEIYPQCRRALGLNIDRPVPSPIAGSNANVKQYDRYHSVDFFAPSGVNRTITNLTLHDENPTTGIPSVLRGVFREGEILSDTETIAPGTTASYTNPSGLKGINNVVGLDCHGNVEIGNLFADGGRLVLGTPGKFGVGITAGNLGPDGYGLPINQSGRTFGGIQECGLGSEDNVLIKLGELNTDGQIDGRNPSDPNWKSFKIGAGASLPADGGGIKVVGEKVDIDLIQGTRFVADYDSALGGTAGSTSAPSGSGKPVPTFSFGFGRKG